MSLTVRDGMHQNDTEDSAREPKSNWTQSQLMSPQSELD
jgi:hypothetical protein